ncbi:hypothetical protein [Ancylobacter sp.]
MRTLERPFRGNCAPAPVDEGTHATSNLAHPAAQVQSEIVAV